MSIIKAPLPSTKLKMMLEEVNQAVGAAKAAFGHAKDAVESAYRQAISEGFSADQAKDLIFKKVKGYSERTLYSYLPDEAKNKKMQALARRPHSLQNCSDPSPKKEQKASKLPTHQSDAIARPTAQQAAEHSITNTGESTFDLNGESVIVIDLNGEYGNQEIPLFNKTGTILLEDELSELIHRKVSLNKSRGLGSQFILKHDGKRVNSVEDSMRLDLEV